MESKRKQKRKEEAKNAERTEERGRSRKALLRRWPGVGSPVLPPRGDREVPLSSPKEPMWQGQRGGQEENVGLQGAGEGRWITKDFGGHCRTLAFIILSTETDLMDSCFSMVFLGSVLRTE